MNTWVLVGLGVLAYYLYSQNQAASTTTTTSSGTAPPPSTTTTAAAQTVSPTTTQSTVAATNAITITIPSGFSVHPDINNSLTGTVLMNGQPTVLSIIQTAGDGRVFNSSGQDITTSLSAAGVNLQSLRAAFASAPGATSGGTAGVSAYPSGNIGTPTRRSPIRPYGRGWLQ